MTDTRLLCLSLAPLLFLAASAGAVSQQPSGLSGAFNIAPLRVDLAQSAQFANLTLTNAMDHRASIQVRIFAWRQEQGRDVFTPTTDFIASPGIFRLDAGAVQQFHVIRQRDFTGVQEQRYRVVIDQLPEAASTASQAAQTRLQLTLPLFVGSDRASPAQISARIEGGQLQLANAGGRTARIGTLALVAADGRRWPVALDRGRYVLGSSMISYDPRGFDCVAAGPVRVTGMIDRASFDVQPPTRCP